MAHIGIDTAKSRHTAQKSAMAAVGLLVALAAVPVLADTAREKVAPRSTTGAASRNPPRKEAMQPGTPASQQSSLEPEQDTYQERFIRRVSGETTGAGGNNSAGKGATRPGTSVSLQVSKEPEQGTYQERFIRRVSGETPTGAGRKGSQQGKEATQSGQSASLPVSQELEHDSYRERFIRRLAGETFSIAPGR